jgi:hypothetical protein
MLARPALALSVVFLAAAPARADVFDRYINPILAKAPEGPGVKEIKKLTPELIEQHGRLVPDTAGVLLVVKTNGGLNSKLIVTTAGQRVEKKAVPMALIERFVTYKASEDRALQATGQNVHLYGGFLFKLDIGQVVPAEVGGDLRFVAEGDQGYVEPVGAAKMYLITKHLPGTEQKKATKPTVGEAFEATFFNGTYKLMDDGRRVAKLTLKVEADGTVGGEYISEASGRAYEVFGKVGEAKHRIQFTVRFPQSEQVFTGYMFTRDGKAICGTTKLQEKEFGFYALRAEEE